MENINWICKAKTVNNNIVWMCHPKVKEHFEATSNTVQLFSAANYGGNSSSFGIGRYTSSQLDKIGPKALQSIKVPSGLVALLYQNADFTGYGKAISADTPDLSKETDSKNTGFNWSNQMQSLIVQPYVALPTSISDSMPKISLVAPDPNSFMTAVSGAVLTRIDDKSYLYVDPNNKDNLFWYNAGDLQIIPPFSMANISGMQLWLDGKDPLNNGNPPADGTSIDIWKDKSSKQNDMKAQRAATYTTSSNSLNFNRSLYNSKDILPYPIDVYIVVKVNDTNGPFDICGLAAKNADDFNSLTFGEYKRNYWHNGSSFFTRTPNAIASSAETSTNFLLMQWSIDEKNFYIKRNGTQIMSTNSYTWNQNPHYFQLGSRFYNDAGNNLVGSISEVLAFDSQLNTTQSQIIEGYLAWKWGLQSNLPDNHPFKSAAPSGSTPFPKTLKTNFTNVSALPSGNWIDAAVSADGKYIVALNNNNNYVWMSKDSGNTWKNINNNAQPWLSVAINQDASFIIASANNGYGFWTSTDMGGSWNKSNAPAVSGYIAGVFGSLDLSIMYITDQGRGILKSTDKGNSWSNCSGDKISGAWNWGCCSNDGSIVAVIAYGLDRNPGFIYVSTDGGNTWSKKGFNNGWQMIACSSDGKIMSAIGGGGDFLVSKDTGQNWEQLPTPIRPYSRCLRVSGDGSTIVIGGDSQIHISKDLGKTWKKTSYSGSNFAISASQDFSVIVALNWNGPVSMISQ